MPEEQFQEESLLDFGPEEDITELKARIERLEKRIEKEPSPEREKSVKQEIKSYIQEVQNTPPFASSLATRDEAKEIVKFQPSQQIGALVSLVLKKGLKQAISVARDLDNPAILDEFHDILVDRYYEELSKRGFLKF